MFYVCSERLLILKTIPSILLLMHNAVQAISCKSSSLMGYDKAKYRSKMLTAIARDSLRQPKLSETSIIQFITIALLNHVILGCFFSR